MSHITTLNGKIYCVYCMNELTQGETCNCKGYKNALAKAQKKETQSKSASRGNNIPPRRKTMK